LSTTFAHKTTTNPLVFSFLPKPYIISYVFKDIFFGTSKVNTKTKKLCWYLSKTNAFLKFKWFFRKVNMYLENLKKDNKNRKKNLMRWLKSWVLFDWINHLAYAHESKTYQSSMHWVWDEERLSLIILLQDWNISFVILFFSLVMFFLKITLARIIPHTRGQIREVFFIIQTKQWRWVLELAM